jgi:hypothetical protein
MSEQERLEALRAVLVFAKAGWASREGNMSFPPQFGVVQRMIDDQQRYLDDPVHLAVYCMGLFADYLPFDMLAVLALSDKHLSDDTIATLETDLEEADGREFEALRFFKLGKGNAEFLIEVPGDDEDWDELPSGDHPHTPTPGATDATPTGSLGPSGDADKLKAAGQISTPALLPGAAAVAGAGAAAAGNAKGLSKWAAMNVTNTKGDDPDLLAYVRSAATKRGIDPDVAMAVSNSEGLRDSTMTHEVVGDKGTSFGPYQLHYGGSGIPGMNVKGLGDDFTKKTGLDARDPATTHQQIDFSLDRAKQNGWTDWHGAKNTGIDRWQGIKAMPGDPTTPPPPAVQAPQLADASQDITKLGQSAAGATGDLSSFGGSLGCLAKSLLGGIGGGGGGLGLAGAGGLASIFGFASGGLINGDGTPTSDSNLAMVSDGEYIVNAAAASKNGALLAAINSGKAPKFSGSSQSAFMTNNEPCQHSRRRGRGRSPASAKDRRACWQDFEQASRLSKLPSAKSHDSLARYQQSEPKERLRNIALYRLIAPHVPSFPMGQVINFHSDMATFS